MAKKAAPKLIKKVKMKYSTKNAKRKAKAVKG